jgi:hypothetical protein
VLVCTFVDVVVASTSFPLAPSVCALLSVCVSVTVSVWLTNLSVSVLPLVPVSLDV